METEQLTNLINQKRDILLRLWQLTERQTALVDSQDLTRLLSLLAGKQTLLNELQAVEEQLHPFRAQDPEARRWRSPEARERTRQVAAECEQLLEKMMQVEQQCESQLVQRRDETSRRLHGVHGVSRARQAYLQPNAQKASQLDISSET